MFTGFDDDELKDLLGDINFEPASAEDQSNLNNIDPLLVKCPNCSECFDARENKTKD